MGDEVAEDEQVFDQSVRFREVATPFEEVSQRNGKRPEVVPCNRQRAVIETSPLYECRNWRFRCPAFCNLNFKAAIC